MMILLMSLPAASPTAPDAGGSHAVVFQVATAIEGASFCKIISLTPLPVNRGLTHEVYEDAVGDELVLPGEAPALLTRVPAGQQLHPSRREVPREGGKSLPDARPPAPAESLLGEAVAGPA